MLDSTVMRFARENSYEIMWVIAGPGVVIEAIVDEMSGICVTQIQREAKTNAVDTF